ncbi:MAG: amidohydrolase family protein [Planctomycetota bacterium]|nr:amidohydrolase family protein [Planctomycetota bacterium]
MLTLVGCLAPALLSPAEPASVSPHSAIESHTDGAQAGTAKKDPFETIFIRAEHVITKPGTVLDDAAVLVRNGRIVAVGTGLSKPDGATELSGKYVCAGFIDAWSALGVASEALVDQAASPATRTADGVDVFNFDHLRRDALRSGVTSARIQVGATGRVGGLGAIVRLAPGQSEDDVVLSPDCNLWMTIGLTQGSQPLFDNQGELIGIGGRAMDPFERVESVDRLVSTLQAGKNYLIAKNEYKHELEAWQKTITEKETELEKDAKKAKKDREKAEKDATEKNKKFEEKKYKEDKKPTAPRIDEDNEVVARAANGELPLIVHANRVAEIRALLQGTESLGRLRLVIAGGAEATFFSKQLAERRIPVLVWPAPLGRNRPDEYEASDLSLAARLKADGVQVLIGSGGIDPAATRDLPLLAGLAIGAGLDRAAAFEALTIGAARVLDASDRIGTVEAGKDADLLVLDGEPLVSTTRVLNVVAGGRVVALKED